MRKLNIAIIGFGCVGQGLYDILNTVNHLKINVDHIVVKNKEKKRSVDESLLSFNWRNAVYDAAIDVVVELIDDADEAYKIVKAALKEGKHVVTANKKMLAHHLAELITLSLTNGVSLLYEGAVGGSIPIIRNLEEYYDNEWLTSVDGIVNGSTNYILTKVSEGLTYEQAIELATINGFLESDPILDLAGFDAKYKLVILAQHAFGLTLLPEQVLNVGIDKLTQADLDWVNQQNAKLKLVVRIAKIEETKVVGYVLPELVEDSSVLSQVANEYNAINLQGAFSDKQTLSGKGAGAHPTGSAVLSDITALSHNYKYEYKKQNYQKDKLEYYEGVELPIYLRFSKENDLKQVNFSSISEWHVSENHSYVLGNISLSELIKANQIEGVKKNTQVVLLPQTYQANSISKDLIEKLITEYA